MKLNDLPDVEFVHLDHCFSDRPDLPITTAFVSISSVVALLPASRRSRWPFAELRPQYALACERQRSSSFSRAPWSSTSRRLLWSKGVVAFFFSRSGASFQEIPSFNGLKNARASPRGLPPGRRGPRPSIVQNTVSTRARNLIHIHSGRQ